MGMAPALLFAFETTCNFHGYTTWYMGVMVVSGFFGTGRLPTLAAVHVMRMCHWKSGIHTSICGTDLLNARTICHRCLQMADSLSPPMLPSSSSSSSMSHVSRCANRRQLNWLMLFHWKCFHCCSSCIAWSNGIPVPVHLLRVTPTEICSPLQSGIRWSYCGLMLTQKTTRLPRNSGLLLVTTMPVYMLLLIFMQ